MIFKKKMGDRIQWDIQTHRPKETDTAMDKIEKDKDTNNSPKDTT